jgi:hypothetical protein
MRKHVLIFIHGMGVYVDNDKPTANWGEGAFASLKDQYEKYPSLSMKFEDVFEPVYINYDTIFHNILQNWANEADQIKSHGVDVAEIALRMVHWLDGVEETDNNFHWTHIGDVVLYRFFSLVRQWVKVSVAKQIHEALEETADGAVSRWSLIAHSLGTIVAHDALHALNASSPNEFGIPIMDALVPKPSVIAMIANVSKTLENNADVYDSAVYPPNACDRYLSANNIYDPFVMEDLKLPEAFDPAGSNANWDKAIAKKRFIDIRPENIHMINVHSIDNYLVNPYVHIPLIQALCGQGSIPPQLEKKSKDSFVNIPKLEVKKELNQLLNKYRDESWYSAIAILMPILEQRGKEL